MHWISEFNWIDALNQAIFYYGITISLSYVLLAIYSSRALNQYLRKNRFVDYKQLMTSGQTPSISLIAPAYNEQETIVENIRSLLNLQYPDMEIIIVNDGSKDETLPRMIAAYALEPVPFCLSDEIPCKPVNAIYRSKDTTLKNLLVIDKVNGGKADALNAGINCSTRELIACIDVDCIILQDGLLRMVKPFLEEQVKVIACGGVVRIANSCVIEDGRLIEANVPRQLLPRFQVIEYLRAFLMGRMAWSKMNGLLLISGAMGMFDRQIVKAVGGYNTKTVGEDMELVVRMRRYMAERRLPYMVTYIPDPICWTEAPASNKILSRQRRRWMRGTMETLWLHKRLLLNPFYGLLGLLSFPYWMIFEWLAPVIEFLGVTYFLYLVFNGYSNWYFFLFLSGAVYTFAICISMYSLLFEELSYRQYKKFGDLLKLVLSVFIEPFVYHPRTSWWGFQGNIDKLRGKGGWGEMTRAGFAKKKA